MVTMQWQLTIDVTNHDLPGYYVYIESSMPRVAGDRAILKSPALNVVDSTKTCTFNFWYNMYGNSIGE